MMHGRFWVSALLVLALSASVVACGDSEDGDSGAPAATAPSGDDGAGSDLAPDGGIQGGEDGAQAGEGNAGAPSGGGNQGDGGGEAGAGADSDGSGSGGSQGGSGSSGGGTASSNADFIKQADAICAKVRQETRRSIAPIINEGLEAIGENAPRIANTVVIPNLERELRELRTIGRPSSADQSASAMFGAIEGMIAEAKTDPGEFIVTGEAVGKAEAVAQQNGFKVCGGI